MFKKFAPRATANPPRPTVKITSHLDTSVSTRVWINQYRRGQRIGKGNHGEVHLCEDCSVDESVVTAVKIVKRSKPRDKLKLMRKNYQTAEATSTRERGVKPIFGSAENSVRKEIAILKNCRHLHICQLIEVIDDPKQEKIYLIMEYLSGGPVEWTNANQEPILTLEQTRRIMRDVLLGLEYLHLQGIIHRDIKPANLMYTSDRSLVKIIDFGIAHIDPTIQFKARRGREKQIVSDLYLFPESELHKRVGTPSFMAPEVVWFLDSTQEDGGNMYNSHRSQQSSLSIPSSTSSMTMRQAISVPSQRPPITAAIDIWSLAVTFYCLLFGRTPFYVPTSANENVHHSEFVLYTQICTQDWTAYETIGAERIATGGRQPKDSTSEGSIVIQLLEQMLQKDPRNRITLNELKCHPWILKDLRHSKTWLQLTSSEKPHRARQCPWIKLLLKQLRRFIPGSKK